MKTRMTLNPLVLYLPRARFKGVLSPQLTPVLYFNMLSLTDYGNWSNEKRNDEELVSRDIGGAGRQRK